MGVNCYSIASSNLHTAFVLNATAAVYGMYVNQIHTYAVIWYNVYAPRHDDH